MNTEKAGSEEYYDLVHPDDRVVEAEVLSLSKEEALTISLFNEKIGSLAKSVEIATLRLQQLEVLKEQLNNNKTDNTNNFNKEKENASRYLETLHLKYLIPPGKKWGYNPDTLEIIFFDE